MNDQQTGNEIWRRALDVRSAWDNYHSILVAVVERGTRPNLIRSLTHARRDVERTERHLFNLVDREIAAANDRLAGVTNNATTGQAGLALQQTAGQLGQA